MSLCFWECSTIFEWWNSVLPNRGNSMLLTILEFCWGLNCWPDIPSCTTMPDFPGTIPQEIGGRSSVRQIQVRLQFLFPPRMCLQRAPSSRRTHTPTPWKHPGLFRQPLEYSTIVMATWSVAALAASNDVFTQSKRLYDCGRQSLVTSCLSLQKTSKNGMPSIGFRDCALTVKSLLLLAREVSRD